MGKLKPINPTKAQIVANPQAAAHDYDNLIHKPQINGHELVGNKSGSELGLQNKLTAGENITINANGEISASEGVTSYNELTDRPKIAYFESYAHVSQNTTLKNIRFSKDFHGWTEMGTTTNLYVNDSNFFKCLIGSDSEEFNVDHPSLAYHGKSISLEARISKLQGCPAIVTDSSPSNAIVIFWQIGDGASYTVAQFISWKDTDGKSRLIYRFGNNMSADLSAEWTEIGGATGTTVSSATVNQNGTITFTMSDGSTVTTTGSVTYTLTEQDKQDIADIVIQRLNNQS